MPIAAGHRHDGAHGEGGQAQAARKLQPAADRKEVRGHDHHGDGSLRNVAGKGVLRPHRDRRGRDRRPGPRGHRVQPRSLAKLGLHAAGVIGKLSRFVTNAVMQQLLQLRLIVHPGRLNHS